MMDTTSREKLSPSLKILAQRRVRGPSERISDEEWIEYVKISHKVPRQYLMKLGH